MACSISISSRAIFFSISDRVKVADFGLVKHLERSGASGIIGTVTPLYAPPETFTGAITERSDQYSLAIVYQELLTGHRPFNGKNPRQLAHQHMNEPPDLRALPEGERPILARALDKDPARRFPSCLAFVRALYSARSPHFANIIHDDDMQQGSTQGVRPKTMRDTLENFQLEGMAPDEPPDARTWRSGPAGRIERVGFQDGRDHRPAVHRGSAADTRHRRRRLWSAGAHRTALPVPRSLR